MNELGLNKGDKALCVEKQHIRYVLQGSIESSSKNAGVDDESRLKSSYEDSEAEQVYERIQMVCVRRINKSRFGMVDWTELKRDPLGYLSIAHLPGYILKCLPRLSLRASSLTDISWPGQTHSINQYITFLFFPSRLVEETEELASNVLATSLLVVHDTSGGGQNEVTELTRGEELGGPGLEVTELNGVAGVDNTTLVQTAVELDDDLAGAVVVNLLEFTDVA